MSYTFASKFFNLFAKKVIPSQLLMAAMVACAVCFFDGHDRPAWAETEVVVIDMATNGQVAHSDLLAEAELLVNDAISRQFSQNPGLSSVQVSVLGHRNGEIIPILTTMVSREQWQSDPRVNAWTRYHHAYTLFQRHDEERIVTMVPARPNGISNARSQDWVDAAYDSGRLTGELAQDQLSSLD